jgi:hypothetical protein
MLLLIHLIVVIFTFRAHKKIHLYNHILFSLKYYFNIKCESPTPPQVRDEKAKASRPKITPKLSVYDSVSHLVIKTTCPAI